NNINIRVYGEKGGIEWHQREPNSMLVKWLDQPMQVYRTANGYLGANAKAATRTPPAHPEGYLEAFANIYKNFASHVRARLEGRDGRAHDSVRRELLVISGRFARFMRTALDVGGLPAGRRARVLERSDEYKRRRTCGVARPRTPRSCSGIISKIGGIRLAIG